MDYTEHAFKALLVSSSDKFGQHILPLLSDAGCEDVVCVSSASAARRAMLESTFDMVLINAPLTDEFGTKMALSFSSDNRVGILLFVKAELFSEINSRAAPYGILTLAKPTSSALISQSLSILLATRERLRRMEQKTATLEEKMTEIRLVNRAKWILIDNRRMTEPEAHRYIEKTAMDRCRTKREIADFIIQTFSKEG